MLYTVEYNGLQMKLKFYIFKWNTSGILLSHKKNGIMSSAAA